MAILTASLCVCVYICQDQGGCAADGPFRGPGLRAIALQLPPLCALIDGLDGVYSPPPKWFIVNKKHLCLAHLGDFFFFAVVLSKALHVTHRLLLMGP
jgi:hypothetical protein